MNIRRVDITHDEKTVRALAFDTLKLTIGIDHILPHKVTRDRIDPALNNTLPTSEQFNSILNIIPGKTVQDRLENLWKIFDLKSEHIDTHELITGPEIIRGIPFWIRLEETPGVKTSRYVIIEKPGRDDAMMGARLAKPDTEAFVLTLMSSGGTT